MGWVIPAIFVYGIAVIGLGVEAYVSKHSLPSLMGGGFSGLLAIVGGLVAKQNPRVGFALAGLGAVVVLVRFGPKFLKDHAVYPGLVLTLLSVAALIAAVVGYLDTAKPS